MTKTTSHLQVATFVPNLIGYGRFITLAIAPWFAWSQDKWYFYLVFYFVSQVLDAFDGKAARMFN